LEVDQPELVTVEVDEHSEMLMSKGRFFHDFANYFSIKTNEEEFIKLLSALEGDNQLTGSDNEHVKELILSYILPAEEMKDKDSPFLKFYAMIDSFIMFEVEQLVKVNDEDFNRRMQLWKPVAVEHKFKSTKYFELPDKLHEEFGMELLKFKSKGIIDRINRIDLEKRELEVMEYKTGNWNSKSSSRKTSVRRELAFYAMMNSPFLIGGVPLERAYYWKINQLSCFNPEAPESINYLQESIGTRTTNALLKQMIRLQLAIEEDDFDRPVCNSFVCMWCNYLDTCGDYYKYQWNGARDGSFQTAKHKRQNERK